MGGDAFREVDLLAAGLRNHAADIHAERTKVSKRREGLLLRIQATIPRALALPIACYTRQLKAWYCH